VLAPTSLKVGILIDITKTINPNKNKNIEVKKSALFISSGFIGQVTSLNYVSIIIKNIS
jgi:hypothetical protein